MEEKANAWITVLFLCAIMLTFTIADFFTSDRLFSENENRILASRPVLTGKDVLSGKYMKDYEEYVTDQFVSRDTWILMKTRGDIGMHKKTINGVYLGKDKYLIEQHLPEDISEARVESRIELLAGLANRYDSKVMLIPTADNIITGKLPANAIYYNQRGLVERVKAAIGASRVIDTFSILLEHREEEIYYRTDHHWTTRGAYYGYRAWARSMKKVPYPYDTAKLEAVTETFLGTLHSRINLPLTGESILIFPETMERKVTVTYDFTVTTDSLYEEKHLDTKNKYGYFLDDNHGFVEIETPVTNGKSLFLIKDSFANCMVPLLSAHYEKIYIVDLRYYHGKLFDLIDQYQTEQGMDVLVLYNCIHFIENFQYY